MDDLISRQEAIDALEREKTYCTAYKGGYTQTDYFKQYNMGLTDGIKALNKLPSAQPERKSGKWIHGREIAREMIGDAIVSILYDGWQCSECKCIVEEECEPLWNFCPNCGANMKGERDERDS